MSSEAYPELDAKPRGIAEPVVVFREMHFEGLITRDSEGNVVGATEVGITVTLPMRLCSFGCSNHRSVFHEVDL